MGRLDLRDGLVALHLGPVERDDLIVQMADFCLQFEGVEWVAVAGKLGPNLVVAVRNHGIGHNNAGEIVKRLFGDIGSAGGHRNMAKAVIPLRAWRQREGTTRDKTIEPRLRELFVAGLIGDEDANESRHHRNGS
jgi:nanoRNase/pAp phosphatase (c-di-AMP/oligoRNAs hydrolase)